MKEKKKKTKAILEITSENENNTVEKEMKEKLFRMRLEKAMQGDASAQCHLGEDYEHGDESERDYEMAVKWYTLSAKQNNTLAMCNLADCFRYGKGVAKDEEKAFLLYKKAAELGDESAYAFIGECYQHGIGVKENPKLAFEAFLHATKSGFEASYYDVGYCYFYGEDSSTETRVSVGVATAELSSDRDFLNEFVPSLGTSNVGFGFLAFGGGPFGVTGHNIPLVGF